MGEYIRRFLIKEDKVYDADATKYQAKSLSAKIFYLLMHLLPGFFALLTLNYEPVYKTLRDLSGLSDEWFQFSMFIFVTYCWHMLLPFLVLRWSDGLNFRESLRFLGLDRIDLKGIFLVLPIIFIPLTIVSAPWFQWIYFPLRDWLASIPAFELPDYSIMKTGFLHFPPFALTFMLIGNFLGEELYYRGYLMKKCAFLGKHTWWITSTLFVVYHFWQIPATWSLILPAMIFGLLMIWRKDLYVLIALHFILNLMWLPWMRSVFG